jgi:hypothetical protein
MNTQAIQNLLYSTRYSITLIDADLAAFSGRRLTPDEMYHQGYQEGRKAVLQSLATVLEMALAGRGVRP